MNLTQAILKYRHCLFQPFVKYSNPQQSELLTSCKLRVIKDLSGLDQSRFIDIIDENRLFNDLNNVYAVKYMYLHYNNELPDDLKFKNYIISNDKNFYRYN